MALLFGALVAITLDPLLLIFASFVGLLARDARSLALYFLPTWLVISVHAEALLFKSQSLRSMDNAVFSCALRLVSVAIVMALAHAALRMIRPASG